MMMMIVWKEKQRDRDSERKGKSKRAEVCSGMSSYIIAFIRTDVLREASHVARVQGG